MSHKLPNYDLNEYEEARLEHSQSPNVKQPIPSMPTAHPSDEFRVNGPSNHAKTGSMDFDYGLKRNQSLNSDIGSQYTDGRAWKDEPFAPPQPTESAAFQKNYASKDYLGERYDVEQLSTAMDDSPQAPLVPNAKSVNHGYYNLEYDDTNAQKQPKGFLAKLRAHYPLEQRIENKKRGIGVQRYPVVVWVLTAVMIGVCIYELVLNAREQGSPISTKPIINPMLGPSSSALINLGARFPPCMKLVADVPPSTRIGCMNNTANPVTSVCTVADLCGFGGIPSDGEPNQWFRFITAIFLHAGIVHLLLNMLAQLVLSAQIERDMGSTGFLLVYFSAGIFGNVLGGNFALVGIPSVGASGAIFGTLAVTWVDLMAHWKLQYRPVRKLIFMTIELGIGIAIGFIPYVDNFAHIGGFVMGLLVGTVFYPVISQTKRHKIIMWSFRIAAIPLAIVPFIFLARNFYTSDPYAACAGCRYLSCIPMAANNYCKGTGLTTTPSQ
ncbi:rhomboid-domain-containing protein [Coprinopsis marcescibilis]|uniref:Rhomboid-type serine protease n=1 Tax=Coprinopsis marcescibilis TaxID=230819 RepID=A0A5C3LBC1_COPMA|nr:rhomboid-domain-containing protein [Coprinopsis marcescibilis]